MIKKILKILGLTFLCTIILGFAFYLYVHININGKLKKKYDVKIASLQIPSDSASLAKGAHLIAIKGCSECHGNNLEGKVINDDAVFGRLVATNLTKGKGGLPQDYNTEDWIRSLKHGLHRSNTALVFMPSGETAKLSEEDMQCLVGYLQQLPPIDNQLPEIDLGFLAEILGYLDQVPLIPAEKIDHKSVLTKSIDRSSPIAYGKYLAISCSSCHRENMKGGDALGPGMPPVPDLTSTGATGRWTLTEFTKAVRTGSRPDGSVMDNNNMPWKMTAQYTDEEITVLYQYFKSIK